MFLFAGFQLLRLILIWKGLIGGLAAGVSLHIISVICLRMFCYSCWLCDEAFPACKHTAAVIETPQTFTMLYIQEQIASMCRFATTRLRLGPVHQERRRSTFHLSESPAAFPSSAKRGTKADLLHMCLPWALSSQTSLCAAVSTSQSSVLRQRGSCLFLLMIHRETER